MTTTNPFDILPTNLFNVLASHGEGSLHRHYLAILLRIYDLAESNRYGLTREVVAEIIDYLTRVRADGTAVIDDLPPALDAEGNGARPSDTQNCASDLLCLALAGPRFQPPEPDR